MARSDSIAKLLPRLISARAEMTKVLKDATNPAFKSAYATLAACLEACEPSLGKHGLAVLQTTRWADGKLTLDTVLAHDSGEWISSEYPVIGDYGKPQSIGAGLTYARRYSYLAITGRAPEDDDGETASGRGATQPQPQRQESPVARRNRESHQGPRGGPACRQPGYGSSNGPPSNPSAAPSANGNGHTKPTDVWGGPGNATATLPAPQTPVAETTDGAMVPVSGGSLGRWVTEIERVHGPGMLAHMLERAQSLAWPVKWAKWSPDQVAAAYRDAMEVMEVVYDVYGDGEADARAGDDDDGRYDDRE